MQCQTFPCPRRMRHLVGHIAQTDVLSGCGKLTAACGMEAKDLGTDSG
jgi:hypothetical protein